MRDARLLLQTTIDAMTDEQILKKITEVVQDQLDNPDVELTPSTVAKDVEGWDSLAHVRITIAIEQAFGLRFSTARIGAISDVGDLIDLVKNPG
jgi:acyl carrier protein